MIESIKHIRSVGRFKEDAPGSLAFKKLTLIHAENAKGKSTLSAVLRSLAANEPGPIIERTRLGADKDPHVVIECGGTAVFQDGVWNRGQPGIMVYDDQFVEDNVHSGLQVESEHRKNLHTWIIGSNAVALDRRVRELAGVIDEHNKQLGHIEARVGPSVLRGMDIGSFCRLAEDTDIKAKIEDVRGRIRAIDQADKIAKAPLLEPLQIESLSLDSIATILGQSLPEIEEAALSRVRDHFTSLGRGGEQWVAQQAASSGSDHAGEPTTCPYCGRSLAGVELVEHYQSYFSDAYRSLIAKIDESQRLHSEKNRSLVVTKFGEAVQAAQQRRSFWAEFDPSLPAIDVDFAAISGCWARLDEAMGRQLQDKQRQPLEQIALSEEVLEEDAALRKHASLLESVNSQITEINAKAERLKSLAQDKDRQTLSDELAQLERIKARYSPDIAQHCNDYMTQVTKKEQTEKDRDEAREQLEEERKRAFDEFPRMLNQYLEEFNADFKIDQMRWTNTSSGTSSDYGLVIEEVPVPLHAKDRRGRSSVPQQFRNTLSAGDRRTLASAIFFAGVDRAAKEDQIVAVIDDPASSLDEHRTRATAHAIGSLAKRVEQVVVLSHSKDFLVKVTGFARGLDTRCLRISDRSGASYITVWDMKADLQDDHVKRHIRFNAFLDGSDDDLSDVAQKIRLHLEHFLRIAFPAEFRDTQMLGSFIDKCRRSTAQGVAIMSNDRIDELDKLNDYSRSFHHSDSPEHRTELVGFVKRTLRFTRPEFDRS